MKGEKAHSRPQLPLWGSRVSVRARPALALLQCDRNHDHVRVAGALGFWVSAFPFLGKEKTQGRGRIEILIAL